jgi:hypothetical protein
MKTIKLRPFNTALTDLFPPMSEAEFDGIVKDISEHGLRDAIDTWKNEIIEGKHRALACQKLGIEPRYHACRFKDEAGARAYVVSKNMHRRHLTQEHKRDLIAKLLKADPTKSDTAIGKDTKTSPHTVAKVRKREEGRMHIAHVDKRTDSKGRKQPATKPLKQLIKVTHSRKVTPPQLVTVAHTRIETPPQVATVTVLPSRIIYEEPYFAEPLSAEDRLIPQYAFAAFTIKNVDDGYLTLGGHPQSVRRWKELRDLVVASGAKKESAP